MRQDNNFDLLRLILASMVFLVHAYVLSGEKDLAFLLGYVSADFAIKGFFVVSGYLIFRSFESSRSLRDYFDKRLRRIYPAFACVIVLCALAGGFVSALPWQEYLSPALVRYLAANLVFMNFLAQELPGVFVGNPLQAVNGALWTIKVEVAFYVSVPVIVWSYRRFGVVRVATALYLFSVAYLVGLQTLAEHTGKGYWTVLSRQLPGQLSYFIVGGLFHYHEAALRRWMSKFALLSMAYLFIGNAWLDPLLTPICLGFVVMYFATGLPSLGNFGRLGDISYGVYIIHFPVLQLMVWKGLFARNATSALILSAILVGVLAVASWHLVEKRWLRKTSHYVVASGPGEGGVQ
ncbi:MAG: acyltransferase family protein [Burkholderiales bacterium]